MIGKVFKTGKTFGETCEYLEREESMSQVLAVEGVRGHDPRLMAEDFEWQHSLMPQKEKPVFHSTLTFPPEERVDDQRLVELSKEYLRRIGMANTQYAVVKHTDKAHLHVHILANRVDNDGKPIGQGLIIERAMKAADELTREYGLRQEHGKRLERTNLAALHEPDVKRYHIYAAIREVLPDSRDLGELERRLQEQGISVRYRHDPETNERQGISFRYDNLSFKGSRVDAGFSLKGLERALDLQERQQLQSLEAALGELVKGRPVGWDEEESARRRQGLKLRLEQAEEERLHPGQRQRLEPGRRLLPEPEERLDQELEQRQVQRRGLRL
jgi:Relaxase/Mobilisation nuclease domain